MAKQIYSWGKPPALNLVWGFGLTNFPLSTAGVLIDDVGYVCSESVKCDDCLLQTLRRWINSFSGSDFKPRLVCKIW